MSRLPTYQPNRANWIPNPESGPEVPQNPYTQGSDITTAGRDSYNGQIGHMRQFLPFRTHYDRTLRPFLGQIRTRYDRTYHRICQGPLSLNGQTFSSTALVLLNS